MRKTAVSIAVVSAVVLFVVATTRANRGDAVPAVPLLDDAAIVAIFDLANTADIESGTLGAQRAQNTEVRDYGTMLAQVHTEVRQKGRDLAKKLGVTPVLPPDNTMGREHAAAMARLSRLSGAEFDRAFVAHEQAFHKAVLDAVKGTLLPAIENQELKNFVGSLGPAFEAHRVMAEHLEKKLAK
jgi:putative membrane protein